jgi:uncharacterized membrane protein YeaQ/YmgE (transglycosylase-associated protein family)
MMVFLFVGSVAGYLSSRVVRGAGFGVVGDACVGIVGAMLGDWLLPRFNFRFHWRRHGFDRRRGDRAIALLLVLRSVGASGWGGAR